MADHPDDLPEVSYQPSLPSLELPEYHGRKPVGMKTAVAGAGNRISRPHSIGDRVIAVIELKVKTAGHEETDDGLVYVEKHKVADFFEVQGESGRRLLSAMRQAYRSADDEAHGREPLPEMGAAGVTDGSGVALTPEELAALHGHDPVRAMVDESLTPCVVVSSDGARELWPDDYPKGYERPELGDLAGHLPEGAGPIFVAQLLNAETGETIGALSPDELEAARVAYLLEAEAAAELFEAAEGAPAGPDDPEYVEPDTADDGKGEPFPDEPAAVSFAGDAPDDEIEVDADEEPDELADVVPIGTPAAELADALGGPTLPTNADFAFVDRPVADLVADLDEITDRELLARLYAAEEQGRGRGLKPRKTALEAIEKRSAELFADLAAVAAPDLPDLDAEGDAFEPDEGSEEWDDTAEPEEV